METTVITFEITSTFSDWSKAYDESIPLQKEFGLVSMFRGNNKNEPSKCVVIVSAEPGQLDKFMEAIYVNPKGEIELKFWQERVVDSFLEQNPELKLNSESLLTLIRDGSEMMYQCPEEECWGDVICINRGSDNWGCGECGMTWMSKAELFEAVDDQ